MANYTVSILTDDVFNGGNLAAETADGGGLSLREALALANGNGNASDNITFAPGLAGGTLFLTNGELGISTDAITIDGDINGNDTPDITISADSALGANDADTRVLTISDSNAGTTISATLNGLVIRDGNALPSMYQAAANGGGIYVREGDAVTLTNSALLDNTATGSGGGIGGQEVSITVRHSTIAGNTASSDHGGGIYNTGHHRGDRFDRRGQPGHRWRWRWHCRLPQ